MAVRPFVLVLAITPDTHALYRRSASALPATFLDFFSTAFQFAPSNMPLRSLMLSALAAQASAVWLAGVNIAGCEFGMNTNVSERVS